MSRTKVNYVDINNNIVSFSKRPKDICFFNVNNERYFIYAIYIEKETKRPDSKLIEFKEEEYYKLFNSNSSYVQLNLESCEEIFNLILQSKLMAIEQQIPPETLGEYLKLN